MGSPIYVSSVGWGQNGKVSLWYWMWIIVIGIGWTIGRRIFDSFAQTVIAKREDVLGSSPSRPTKVSCENGNR